MGKASKAKHHKLTLKEFIWFGFNFVVGTMFISMFSNFVVPDKNNDGLGLWVLLVWFVVGGFAFVCAKAFAKMSRCHDSSQNGASYVYVRSTFGKLPGLFIGFIQYCYLPFSLTYQIMSCVRANLSIGFVGSDSIVKQDWGAFTDLYMDLISMCLFFLCAVIIFLGVRWFKRLSNATATAKWFAFALMIMAAFWIIFTNGDNGQMNGTTNFNFWTEHSKFDIFTFIKCFNSCFFAFLGFEIAITAGKNIQDPNKTIGKGIILIISIAILFYIGFTFLFICSAYGTQLVPTYNVAIFDHLNTPKGVILALSIVAVISIVSLRLYSFAQKSMYGGTTLQPLATEGYFPDKFNKLNNEGLPIAASKLNLIITLSSAFIWLVIPDIIKGSMIATNSNNMDQGDVFINISALTSFASILAITIYIAVLLSTLYLMITKKIASRSKFSYVSEISMFSFAAILLAFVFIYHYYALIENVINNHNISDLATSQPAIKAITALAVELLSTVGMIAFFYAWYYTYYSKKIQTRTISQQKKLDEPFKLLPSAKNII